MFDNFVSALCDRFRQQYPQGSIVSDLVQIHGDQYVVKVSVSLENTVLVSTLAVDANLMLAENRAMERALTILGIRDAQQPAHEPMNLNVTPLPDLLIGLANSVEQPEVAVTSESLSNGGTNPNSSEPLVIPVVTNLETTESPIIIEKTSVSLAPAVTVAEPIRIQVGVASEILEQSIEFNAEPCFPAPNAEMTISTTNGKVTVDPAPPETLPELLIEPLPEPEVPIAKSSGTKKAAATLDPLPAVAEAPFDETTVAIAEPPLSVTDMIPMINMELKRLGWSKDRGREYMVSLYNKRASALLSDDELFGLLQHLRAELIV
jgi:hypothetical protein